MPSSGSGTGTPISGGSTLTVAQPLIRTLLSLSRWAKILGITPPHFFQASGIDVFPVSGCSDVWFQFSWQNSDAVSRDELSQVIYDAEEDIASILGYYPAPKWIAKEMHKYPTYYRQELYGNGRNIKGQHKSVITKRGKFIQAGRRAVSVVQADANVVYSDADGDGYKELATVTASTSLTDRCEIHCYIAGQGGAAEWEIRPAQTVSLSGGVVTFTFDAWLLLDPDLQGAYPTSAGLRAIPLETITNYVETVDIYREYTDSSQASAEFSWGSGACTSCGGSGCAICANTIQEGCIYVREVDSGIVVPTPGTYDDDAWQGASFTECREPDTVKIWYYAGELSEKYLRGETCEPLSDYLAQTIAMLATARLEHNICACDNAYNLAKEWRTDLSFSGEAGSYQVSEDDLENPFGVRKGEVMAWKRISRLTQRIGAAALV